MKEKLGIGIIGCSSIANRITIPSIIESNFCKLENIGSRSISKAKKAAIGFQCEKYGNYDEILEDKGIDIVYISLPIALQEYWVIKAAKAGKHILCEKSISTSLSSIKKILKECKKNKVQIMEGFSYKYHPQHKLVEKILKQKIIGEVHNFTSSFILPLLPSSNNFRFNRKLGGGILNDVGCYIINASRFFLKDEPISITCNLFRNKKYDVDIRGSMYLSFNNEKTCFGLIGYEKIFFSEYRIFCENGNIKSNKAYNVKKIEKTEIEIFTKKIKTLKVNSENQTRLMIDAFCKNINSNKLDFSGEIFRQGRVMEGARISSKKKKTFFLRDLK